MEAMRELRIRFTGDARDLKRAADDAEKAMKEVEKTQKDAGASAADLGKKLGALAAAYISLSGAMDLAKRGLQGLANQEQGEIAFKVLLGSAEAAKAKMQELTEFAAKTPFELPGIVEAAKMLETYGLNSTKYLKDAGDLASAFNTEISDVARVMGRINAGDFGEAFQRLRDFGISTKELKGEGLVFDKSGSYVGSVDAALTAVQDIIRRKFGGMMEEQSRSFTGQMSTLADNIQMVLNNTMESTFNGLKDRLSNLNENVLGDGALQKARQWGVIINDGLVLAIEGGEKLTKILFRAADGWLKLFQQAHAMGAFGDANARRTEAYNSAIDGLRRVSPNDPRYGQTNQWTRYKTFSEGMDAARSSMGYNAYQAEPLVHDAMVARVKDFSVGKSSPEILGYARSLGLPKDTIDKLFKALSKANQVYSESMVKLSDDLEGSATQFKSKVDQFRNKKDGTSGGATGGKAGGGTGGSSHVASGASGSSWQLDATLDSNALDRLLSIGKVIDAAPSSRLGLGVSGSTLMSGFSLSGGKALPSFIGLTDSGKATKKLEEDAEKALRSGLEAGVATFLDGGIGNLGEATYSLSKQALSKGLVDGLMSGQFKDALGGLGASLGPILTNPLVAAVGLGITFGIQNALKTSGENLSTFDGLSKKYGAGPKSEAEKELEWLLKYSSDLEKAKDTRFYTPDGYGLKENTEAMRLRDANIDAQLQSNNDLISVLQDLVKVERQRAEDEKAYAGIIEAAKFREQLGGAAFGIGDIRGAVKDATGVDLSRIDQSEALRLTELYGKLEAMSNDPVSGTPRGIASQIAQQGTIANEIKQILETLNGGADIPAVLKEYILPALAQMRQLNGGATAGIGTLGEGENALTFDAPQTRNIVNNNQFIVQSQAFMGDKSDARAFALMIANEIRTIEGQAV